MNKTANTKTEKQYPLGKQVCLGSSSEGNSFYIEINRQGYPRPFKLLIDCGFTTNELRERMLKKGLVLSEVDAVLITHEHNDHSLAVKDLYKMGIKIYAPYQVFDKWGLPQQDSKYLMEQYKLKQIADGIRVFGIPLEHDVYNLGYIIMLDNDFKIGFFTDTGMIKQRMRTWKNPITLVKEPLFLNVIFIEANYITYKMKFAIKKMEEKLKQSSGGGFGRDRDKLFHWKRVLATHMSAEHTGMILAGNKKYDERNGKLLMNFEPIFDISRTNMIYLIHLTSDTKKNEREFADVVRYYIKKANLREPKIVVCKANGEMI